MSKEKESTILSLVFVEKISGFILAVAGAILMYHTNMNLKDLGGIGPFIMAVSLILIIIGILLIVAKTE